MIVHYFDVIRTVVFPSKTDPPLFVDPDTVLLALFPDNLSISGTRAEVAEFHRALQHHSLRSGAFLKPENCLTFSPPKKFSVFRSSKTDGRGLRIPLVHDCKT